MKYDTFEDKMRVDYNRGNIEICKCLIEDYQFDFITGEFYCTKCKKDENANT